jgi:DNA-3-methyladenine glycosylase I
MARTASAVERCPWCGNDPLYMAYHDEEWGVPVRDDRTWFEFLVLEGAQAGLSWLTILKKRGNYRRAFDDFDVHKVARYTPAKVEKLLQDAGIVRNRLKIESTISNAKAFIAVQKEFGSFDAYMWQWVNGVPVVNRPRTMKDVPASTELSDRISKDMKKRGFRFVGSTIIYAHLQATGVVNDHLVGCHRHPDNLKASTRSKRP